MTVAFFSNYLNHHQLPFCLAMKKLIGDNFTFVATERISKERLSMGYLDMNNAQSFVLREYEAPDMAMKLALENDVVILGSAPEKYIVGRLKAGKLTFRYSERIFKKGYASLLSPRVWYYSYMRNIRFKHSPLYMLCASAYAAADYAMFGAYKNKAYKWGYFPPFTEYNLDELFRAKNNFQTKVSLLWVGRLLELKHPESAIFLAEQLKQNGYDFELNIIGSGSMEEVLKQRIAQGKLDDAVHMLGSLSPEIVRKYMENASIFLFTSDFNEGWGAVLNEAMNSGCAVVASHAIGSVPFLIKSGINGVIYENGDLDELFQIVADLIAKKQKREFLGKNAFLTIKNMWNAETAARRFLELASCLNTDPFVSPFREGPCSPAEKLKNSWISKQNVHP